MEQWRDAALNRAVHVDSRNDLPDVNKPEIYHWDGGFAVVKGTERKLLEMLRTRPVFCASRMQLSCYVVRLREKGVPIHTFEYRDKQTGGQFGVYCLSKRVTSKEYA